jgi:hypothetical protein
MMRVPLAQPRETCPYQRVIRLILSRYHSRSDRIVVVRIKEVLACRKTSTPAKASLRQPPLDVTSLLSFELHMQLSTSTNATMKPIVSAALRRFPMTFQRRSCQMRAPFLSLGSTRGFHCSKTRCTDGVFKELTSMRVRTPWVEAFRQQQAEGKKAAEPSGKPEVPKDRNLKAKHMNDSYHSVVLPLARDPWLLDTYLNSSGHIRLGTIFMDLDALSGIIACKLR